MLQRPVRHSPPFSLHLEDFSSPKNASAAPGSPRSLSLIRKTADAAVWVQENPKWARNRGRKLDAMLTAASTMQ